ncbi:MAG TPA: hypothetical protein VKZ61_07085 [Thermomicrobiales bacterium]|nr:hypothetical protein [Thermomicrobiales bacterium]
MIRKLTLILSLVLGMALTSTALAQTPAADPTDALNELDTDVAVYGRTYEGDLSAQPEEGEERVLTAIVQAYELDDADVAKEALPHVEQLMKNELEPIVGVPFETEEVDDMGDTASLSTAELEESGQSISVSLLLVQQDNVIFLSAAVVMGGDAETTANDFMEFMLDAEAGDSADTELAEDGTSTGGYFDTFPTDEDTDVVGDLQVTEDMYETTN